MSVRRAQLEISSPEFTEWIAYEREEPFGDVVADARHGIACALLANVNRNSEVRPDPFVEDDFIPWRRRVGADVEDDLTLLDDPVAQSNLIRAMVFGLPPR